MTDREREACERLRADCRDWEGHPDSLCASSIADLRTILAALEAAERELQVARLSNTAAEQENNALSAKVAAMEPVVAAAVEVINESERDGGFLSTGFGVAFTRLRATHIAVDPLKSARHTDTEES